jgi:hypothetical protein
LCAYCHVKKYAYHPSFPLVLHWKKTFLDDSNCATNFFAVPLFFAPFFFFWGGGVRYFWTRVYTAILMPSTFD